MDVLAIFSIGINAKVPSTMNRYSKNNYLKFNEFRIIFLRYAQCLDQNGIENCNQ
jgi:hypothetical protein